MDNLMRYGFPMLLITFMAWAITSAIRGQKKADTRVQGITHTSRRTAKAVSLVIGRWQNRSVARHNNPRV
jgi:hypothetical protein